MVITQSVRNRRKLKNFDRNIIVMTVYRREPDL